MSKTIYIAKFEDDEGDTYVDWGTDAGMAVVSTEFYALHHEASEREAYNWVRDMLDEADRIKDDRLHDRMIDWICYQANQHVDLEFETEEDLRAWNPDPYAMNRMDFTDQMKVYSYTLKPDSPIAMSVRVTALERMLEIAKAGAELEAATPGTFNNWYDKEVHNA